MSKPEKTIAEAKTEDGVTIQLDVGSMLSEVDKKLEVYKKELKEYYEKDKDKDKQGKGVVEAMGGDKKTKLVEELRNVRERDIKEQWTITLPALTAYELAAHLRNYVFVSEVIKGSQGEIVNIPYVKDFDFVHCSATEADELTEASGVISTLTTTLKEAGRWVNPSYGDIEMIDSNLLDELNNRFATAAVRAEDYELISLVGTHVGTTGYAGDVNYGGTETAAFYAKYIPEAIGKLLQAGKDVHPGQLILYINPRPYAALLTELAASQAFTYPRGDVVKTGLLDEYLGVKIVVGAHVESWYRTTSTGTGTYELAFLMRAKRALALAPKRDILIETDRQIKERTLKIVGSHTFGVVELDPKEVVRIVTNQLTT